MQLFFRFLPATLLALAVVPSARPAETKVEAGDPGPPEVTRLIADFRTKLPDIFSNGTWQGKLALSPNGFVVQGGKGADGKGEMGQRLGPPLDLSKEKFVELALGVGAKNEVPTVTIAFSDVGGTQYVASVRIDQVLPQLPVWFRVRQADFKLNNWQGDRAAKTIDWTHISQWHLQGDWITVAPFHVIFIALRTRQ